MAGTFWKYVPVLIETSLDDLSFQIYTRTTYSAVVVALTRDSADADFPSIKCKDR